MPKGVTARGWFAIAALALMAGCAQVPAVVPEQSVPQASFGGAAVRASDQPSKTWLDGGVSIADPLDLVTYKAEYVIEGGDVLPRLDESSTLAPVTAVPNQLGGDAFKQSVATRLPSFIGGQPQFSFTSATGTNWNAWGETLRRDRQAELIWNPAPVNLQMQWSAPRTVTDPNRPLDCGLGGNLQLGLGSFIGISNQSLALGARACNVDAPDRVATGLGVDSWSGAWQFGRDALSNKLVFTMLETAPTAALAVQEPTASGYEVKFVQTRASGSWIGDSAVGVRRVADLCGADDTSWTAQANIRREVYQMAVTAGWQRDADPLWFVPGVARPVDQVVVGLDMRRWITQQLGIADVVNASLNYKWSESSDRALGGGAVYWNLSKAW